VCVFTAPVFSAFAAWATYLLTKEVKGTGAGLTAAALIAMVRQADPCVIYKPMFGDDEYLLQG
jgi:hypothetical protein